MGSWWWEVEPALRPPMRSRPVTKKDLAELWRAVARARVLSGDLDGATRARRAVRMIDRRDGWRHPSMADLPAPQHLVPVTWNRYRDRRPRRRT